MTDDELIGYCEIHCKTERAQFHASQINRMLVLSGAPGQPDFKGTWANMHEEMQELVEMAKAEKLIKGGGLLRLKQLKGKS